MEQRRHSGDEPPRPKTPAVYAALHGSTIRVRRARPEDRRAMLDMTRDVWGGDDYVPFAWDRWLLETAGALMVAVLDGQTVGLQHLEIQPDGGAWLEGIRVDPAVKGRGIGSLLLAEGIDWARRMACPAVRLSTSSRNAVSNRMVERAGLKHIASFQMVEASPASDVTTDGARVGLPSDRDAVRAFLENRGQRFYSEGWTAYRLTARRLGVLLARGSVAIVGERELEAVAIATFNGQRPQLRLGLLTGLQEGMTSIATWLRGCASQASLESVRGPVGPGGGAIEALEQAGYRSNFEHGMFLHELVFAESG